jgi:hypothetical protein
MNLPMVPPTNPPAYVDPLRIDFSSVNSTVETMNCTGDADRRADRLAAPPRRAVGSQPTCPLVSIVKAFAAGASPAGRRRRRPGTTSERSGDRGPAARTIAISATRPASAKTVPFGARAPSRRAGRTPYRHYQGFRKERLKGLEPSTFCMAKLKSEARFSRHGGFPYGTGRFPMAVRDGFGTQVVLNKLG